ncbi:MAG: CHAT domain-containing protein, partial [Gammaproteobacteria bacterium]
VRSDASGDNEKSSVPFAQYRSADWLARTHAFTSLPTVSSLRSLRLLENREPGSRPFVGFGAPRFSPANGAESGTGRRAHEVAVRAQVETRAVDSADLGAPPPLPETAEELRRVAAALGANEHTDVYLGASATEHQVRSMNLSSYRVIAFAIPSEAPTKPRRWLPQKA